MQLLKKFPLILLLLVFAVPSAVQASALTTGVPVSLTVNSTQQIHTMHIWMLRGWINSGIPLSLSIDLEDQKVSGGTVHLHSSITMLDELDMTVFDTDKSEVLVEISLDSLTDPVTAGGTVAACVQMLLNKGNGTVVPFGVERCELFDGDTLPTL